MQQTRTAPDGSSAAGAFEQPWILARGDRGNMGAINISSITAGSKEEGLGRSPEHVFAAHELRAVDDARALIIGRGNRSFGFSIADSSLA